MNTANERSVWVEIMTDGREEYGEVQQIPYRELCLTDDYYPVVDLSNGISIGYVPTDWWLTVGKAFVADTPLGIIEAASSGNEENAIERFVQDANAWHEGVAD